MELSNSKLYNNELPDNDIQQENSTFITHTKLSNQIKMYISTSSKIKKNINNFRHSFNIIENIYGNESSNPPNHISIQETYNPNIIIPVNKFLTEYIKSSKSIVFYIFDTTLFFIKANQHLNQQYIYPIFMDLSNLRFNINKSLPCLTNISYCYTENNKNTINLYQILSLMNNDNNYNQFFSPDTFAMKYAIINKIQTFEPIHITNITNIIKQHYQNIIPSYVHVTLFEQIETYIQEYYAHMSIESSLKYNIENINKLSTYSILLYYLHLIQSYFITDNVTIQNTFITPIIKFLNPKFLLSNNSLYDIIHNIFYIETIKSSNIFEIIHTAFKHL
jgi:hypothetical protein